MAEIIQLTSDEVRLLHALLASVDVHNLDETKATTNLIDSRFIALSRGLIGCFL